MIEKAWRHFCGMEKGKYAFFHKKEKKETQ